MSKIRPELIVGKMGDVCPRDGTAFLLILNAVRRQPGLLHGKLADVLALFPPEVKP